MTMNSSGAISLGGATVGQSINLENGLSATAQVSLNDTAVRNLAGVASGQITMPTNFYGKSNRAVINYTYSANTANASLNLSAIGGYVAGKSDITVTINSGVYLYSTSTGGYGLSLSGATTGDTVTIINNGYILGMGGKGGQGNQGAPQAGGVAFNLNTGVNPIITNTSGYIAGGGGGGGGSGDQYFAGGGGGAGGGAGGNVYFATGGTGGGAGSSGNNGGSSNGTSAGGGGGRIVLGTGGASQSSTAGGLGGGSGGSGGVSGDAYFSGKSWTYNYWGCAGGGGGWGASGGQGRTANTQSGAGFRTSGAGGSGGSAGGNANSTVLGSAQNGAGGGKGINLNGKSITWTGGSASSSRVYGAIS